MDQNSTPQPASPQSTEQEAQAAVQQVMPPEKKPGRKALTIFAIAVLMGLVGYGVYAWQNTRVTTLQTQVDDLKKEGAIKTVTKADPYAGWSTYSSIYQGVTFKYPSSWTLKKTALDASMWPNAYNVKLTGPNGLVITYIDVVDGIGGGCEDTAPRVVLSDVAALDESNGSTDIYMVTDNIGASGLIDFKQAGGIPKVGKTASCMYYTTINAKKHDNQIAFAFGSGYMIGTVSSKPTAAQTKDDADGKLILKSFKFTD